MAGRSGGGGRWAARLTARLLLARAPREEARWGRKGARRERRAREEEDGHVLTLFIQVLTFSHNTNMLVLTHFFFMCITIYKQNVKRKNKIIFRISSRY